MYQSTVARSNLTLTSNRKKLIENFVMQCKSKSCTHRDCKCNKRTQMLELFEYVMQNRKQNPRTSLEFYGKLIDHLKSSSTCNSSLTNKISAKTSPCKLTRQRSIGDWVILFMPRSHQTFCLVSSVNMLMIMLRNRCWPTIFLTIAAGHANGWCQKWPV